MQRLFCHLSVIGLFACLLMGTGACKPTSNHKDSIQVSPQPVEKIDTAALIVMEVNRCARLYTSEYQIHKIVTHSDDPRMKGSFLGIPVDMKTRIGNRKIAIPINVTLKAYIDFSDFDEKNVERSDSAIIITLPDPKIIATASQVDHKGTRQYIDLTRSKYSDEEITNFSKQGADSILNHISQYGIAKQAQASAAHHLYPIMKRMGYKDKDIVIRFRKNFTDKDYHSMIQKQ